MDGDRSKSALARIEVALSRIEAAKRQSPGTPGGSGITELQARHDKLRAAVQDSLGQLDQLIESAQG